MTKASFDKWRFVKNREDLQNSLAEHGVSEEILPDYVGGKHQMFQDA
eukprot:CAMPEP_0204870396 /NCGR_PEP_ID=MMETSP1348-20121228/32313_1 /ASSEMBLY_ACC=CAM_ASM_000700 /TAXON_ID=215587 /ORGANISM="Aplanochytrium stocchinoi, Strain GSBS06" /LENGTH=46 /DNA_ID= /DNA_START= /DNA_END= /DNA_ORIENTATION=